MDNYLDNGDNLNNVGRQMNLSFWGKGDLVLDDLEEFSVDLDGGASDVLDFATDDGSFAFHALHVGFDALHVAAEDTHLLAFLQRGRIGGDFLASTLYELAVVFQLGVGDSVDVFTTGHGEHLIDIGTKPISLRSFRLTWQKMKVDRKMRSFSFRLLVRLSTTKVLFVGTQYSNQIALLSKTS